MKNKKIMFKPKQRLIRRLQQVPVALKNTTYLLDSTELHISNKKAY